MKKSNNIFHSLFLGLGSNLGNKEENIEYALNKIEEQIGDVVSLSALYFSKPVGFQSNNQFINCAAIISTTLLPDKILSITQEIEIEMGRTEKSLNKEYKDRIIDIDILFYDQEVMEQAPTLVIPHPHLHEREFVLKPLSEIAPCFIHPVLKKTVQQLLDSF